MQLGAQGLDVRVHRAVYAGRVHSPYGAEQVVAGSDAATVLQQIGQQAKLAARQIQHLALEADALAGQVDLKRALAQALCRRHRLSHARSPEQAAHTRQQFARAKRFSHIVVSAQLKPEHAVNFLAMGTEHQYRQVACRTYFAAQVKAAAVRQAHVQNQQVGRTQRQLAARIAQQQAVGDLKSITLKRLGDGPGDGRVIFHQQDVGAAHAGCV